jgi:hypothetical protein
VLLTYAWQLRWARPAALSAVDPAAPSVDSPLPAAYALAPLNSDLIRNPSAVRRALGFLNQLQPDGTYILSRPGGSDVVPMDLAHSAIALVKANQVDRAKAAMTWLYQSMIRRESDRADTATDALYGGSWDDDLTLSGAAVPGSSRGRGEAVGMALIATSVIADADPGFLGVSIGGTHVSDLVRESVDYLTQPAMRRADGSFAHSPEYGVAFDEECARMTLGLELASKILLKTGDPSGAKRAADAAEAGLKALQRRQGMSQGMAYDFYAMGIWGLGSRADAQAEIGALKSTGLASRSGVHNWDWQLTKPASLLTRLHWWAQSQTISPSETFDYAIACVSAGDVATAIDLEQRWLPLQRSDGGFADAYLLGLRIGLSDPTSYAVARFILLERLLTDVAGGTKN